MNYGERSASTTDQPKPESSSLSTFHFELPFFILGFRKMPVSRNKPGFISGFSTLLQSMHFRTFYFHNKDATYVLQSLEDATKVVSIVLFKTLD
jgi:hypothetical protein